MPNSTRPKRDSNNSTNKLSASEHNPCNNGTFNINTFVRAAPYLTAFAISTVLYVWFAFLSSTGVYNSLLPFIPEQAANGSWWQWLSGHFMHSNFIHYFVNMIGLGLLWMLHGEYASAKSFTLNFIIIAIGVSVGIFYFSPHIKWYVGMSAVLHGLFAWGVVIDIYFKRKTGYLLLLGLVIKLCDEQLFSSSTFMADLIEVSVAIDAHLYGAITGLLLGVAWVIHDTVKLRK